MKKEYLNEMVRQLIRHGYDCLECDEKGVYKRIIKGVVDCYLFDNGLINTNAYHEVNKITRSTREYLELFETADEFVVEGLREGYKKLLEHNKIILAMKEMATIDGYEFVTWEYDHDHRGVNLGHYHMDYEAAKEDFAERSGLVDRTKLFSETQMKLIYNGLVSLVSLSEELDYDTEKEIARVLDQILLVVPEIMRHQKLEDMELLADDGLEL